MSITERNTSLLQNRKFNKTVVIKPGRLYSKVESRHPKLTIMKTEQGKLNAKSVGWFLQYLKDSMKIYKIDKNQNVALCFNVPPEYYTMKIAERRNNYMYHLMDTFMALSKHYDGISKDIKETFWTEVQK